MIDQKKADMKGWTPKKHLRGWTPRHGWTPKNGHKVERNVPIREGKTGEQDPITGAGLTRELDLRASLPVTVERLERALALCAYLVERDGLRLVPLFERLERELAAMRQTDSTMDRVKRLLASYSGQYPLLSLAPPIDHVEEGPSTGVHSTAPQPASDPQ